MELDLYYSFIQMQDPLILFMPMPSIQYTWESIQKMTKRPRRGVLKIVQKKPENRT